MKINDQLDARSKLLLNSTSIDFLSECSERIFKAKKEIDTKLEKYVAEDIDRVEILLIIHKQLQGCIQDLIDKINCHAEGKKI